MLRDKGDKMILDGNSKVGSAKVYATQKEMNQHFEIEELKKQNEIMKEALEAIKQQDKVRGFPTASEWHYLVFTACQALEKRK